MNIERHKSSNAPMPWCIAHRGASREAPENTWSAFKKALEFPIDGIELDVQMSADGTPVLYHDNSIWRVARRRKRLADFTFAQLNQLDWGAWYDPSFQGEPLMTLQALLEKVDRSPRWLIEIKSSPQDRATGHAYRLAEKVIGQIQKYSPHTVNQRILILSFDPQVLAVAHNLASDLKYVLNLAEKEPLKSLETAPIAPEQLWAVDVKISHLSEPLVQWARAHGLKLFTYTCNGPRQVTKALKLNVDAILSDRPGWLTQLIKGATGS